MEPHSDAPSQQQWPREAYAFHQQPELPHISQLLLREADAWRALLSLHAATVASAQQIAQSSESSDAALEKEASSEAREATYCSALTSLASQADALIAEALKLRTLRKARKQIEIKCFSDILRSHADEVVAVGQSLASTGSMNVAAATTELRVAIQHQRSQVSQLRSLLDAVATASSLPLDKGGSIVVGVADEAGERTLKVDEVMQSIYSEGRELNETSLASALSRLFLSETASPDVEPRQFSRRRDR